MKNPVTGLGLPQQKEVSLERGQLRAFPARRGREMSIAGRETDLKLAAGSMGCWGSKGKVSGGAKFEPWLRRVAPLLGEVVWENFVGTLLHLTFSDALLARK